MVVELDC